LLGLILPLAACTVAQHPEQVGARLEPASRFVVDSVVLERTRCYGTCPAYRLRLAGTGHVAFESRNPGDADRTATDSVPSASVAELLRVAEEIGFFELPDVIATDPRLCPARATDHPTASVTIYRSEGVKRVEDYHGCYAATDHSLVPVVGRLRAFEAAIDSTAGSARWVRPVTPR
jgi:hypothetical protein